MKESTLRALIKRYTKRKFGTEIWPHLFRDCLLTSVAMDEPELMRISASLLGHAGSRTGKHYNEARMLDGSRRYGEAISELRDSLVDHPPEPLGFRNRGAAAAVVCAAPLARFRCPENSPRPV